jgi:hypothetical protein
VKKYAVALLMFGSLSLSISAFADEAGNPTPVTPQLTTPMTTAPVPGPMPEDKGMPTRPGVKMVGTDKKPSGLMSPQGEDDQRAMNRIDDLKRDQLKKKMEGPHAL